MTLIRNIFILIFIILVVYIAFTRVSLYKRVSEITQNPEDNSRNCFSDSTNTLNSPSLHHEYIFYECALYPHDKSIIFYKDAKTDQVVNQVIVNDTLDHIVFGGNSCMVRIIENKEYEYCYSYFQGSNSREIFIKTPFVEVID